MWAARTPFTFQETSFIAGDASNSHPSRRNLFRATADRHRATAHPETVALPAPGPILKLILPPPAPAGRLTTTMHRSLPTALLGALLLSAAGAAESANDVKGLAPVSVSSANYRNTPRDQLLRSVENAKGVVNPESPTLQPLATPQHFIFMPGEIYDADVTYEQLTALLTPALAKKNFINGADAQGIIREPTKVSLVLRVHYGARPWRLPTVRSTDLTWSDGMVARPKGRGLHTLGADQLWDQRAGGNDETFSALAANASNTQSFGFGSGATGSASSSAASGSEGALATGLGSGASNGGVEYGSTRDFHLIVIDAFDYQELKKDGKAAKRLWTTFVSAPKEPKQKFSAIAATLIRNATPYFGETTAGLQVYSDRRAEVKIGELIEVKDEAKK